MNMYKNIFANVIDIFESLKDARNAFVSKGILTEETVQELAKADASMQGSNKQRYGFYIRWICEMYVRELLKIRLGSAPTEVGERVQAQISRTQSAPQQTYDDNQYRQFLEWVGNRGDEPEEQEAPEEYTDDEDNFGEDDDVEDLQENRQLFSQIELPLEPISNQEKNALDNYITELGKSIEIHFTLMQRGIITGTNAAIDKLSYDDFMEAMYVPSREGCLDCGDTRPFQEVVKMERGKVVYDADGNVVKELSCQGCKTRAYQDKYNFNMPEYMKALKYRDENVKSGGGMRSIASDIDGVEQPYFLWQMLTYGALHKEVVGTVKNENGVTVEKYEPPWCTSQGSETFKSHTTGARPPCLYLLAKDKRYLDCRGRGWWTILITYEGKLNSIWDWCNHLRSYEYFMDALRRPNGARCYAKYAYKSGREEWDESETEQYDEIED